MEETTPIKYDPMDPFTLLCERCGYVIEGLDQDGVCPECGKPIVESLPGARIGTAWQQKQSKRNLFRTWWMMFRYPKKSIELIRFDHQKCIEQLTQTLILILLVGSVGTATTHLVRPRTDTSILNYVIGFALIFGISTIIGLFISAYSLAFSGICVLVARSFPTRFRHRINADSLWNLTAHGSFVWLSTAAIVLGGQVVERAIWIIEDPQTDYEKRILIYKSTIILERSIEIGLAVGSFLLVYFVMRNYKRCAYANRVCPQEPSDG